MPTRCIEIVLLQRRTKYVLGIMQSCLHIRTSIVRPLLTLTTPTLEARDTRVTRVPPLSPSPSNHHPKPRPTHHHRITKTTRATSQSNPKSNVPVSTLGKPLRSNPHQTPEHIPKQSNPTVPPARTASQPPQKSSSSSSSETAIARKKIASEKNKKKNPPPDRGPGAPCRRQAESNSGARARARLRGDGRALAGVVGRALRCHSLSTRTGSGCGLGVSAGGRVGGAWNRSGTVPRSVGGGWKGGAGRGGAEGGDVMGGYGMYSMWKGQRACLGARGMSGLAVVGLLRQLGALGWVFLGGDSSML